MSLESRLGRFIVLEGLDGAGKTSIANMLVEFLKEKGYEPLYTYEPYDTLYVKALKSYNNFRDAYLDALTYAVDRLVHVKQVIFPGLKEGKIVISDRYYYSSVAYQSAQGAPREWVLEINKFTPEPDLAIYLDVTPITGLKRRAGLSSRFPEYEKLEFLEKVRETYLWMVEKGLLVKIDAERDLKEVYREVERYVLEILP